MRRTTIILIALFALAGAFYGGFFVGSHQNKAGEGAVQEAIASRWVKAEKPPLPKIIIVGEAIPVKLSAYSWCGPSVGDSATCTSVDASIPEIEPVVVKGGSLIEQVPPPRIKEFSLTNTSKAAGGSDDPYYVPAEKGVYLYHIHCEWFLDQGQAEFYFAVEVK
ncbi:hypothetical protein [Paenibacillus sp. CF384]|uniref:hypothetical protein n=1 Tax=Paenibacillus sp. CF384 TaxID=1884382 RepID=UPI0008965F85|nr:hypothetical protein [Paenibacillus sp. CF384]SDX33652.1 hypothetical protein SAMN05518855_1012111 [Paenibacillus sp. CF384]